MCGVQEQARYTHRQMKWIDFVMDLEKCYTVVRKKEKRERKRRGQEKERGRERMNGIQYTWLRESEGLFASDVLAMTHAISLCHCITAPCPFPRWYVSQF